jgi:diguanylate cyclase
MDHCRRGASESVPQRSLPGTGGGVIRRFLARVLLPFAGLMAAIQLVTLFAVLGNGEDEALQRATEKLQVGASVLRSDLRVQGQVLLDRADELRRDPALGAALVRGGRPARDAVLAEHAIRPGAGVALLIGSDGEISAASPGTDRAPGLAFRALVDTARRGGDTAGIAMYAGVPHQIVLRPLPSGAGFVGMGRALGEASALELREKTRLEVSVWAERVDTGPSYMASTLPAGDRPGLWTAMASFEQPPRPNAALQLPETEYLTLLVPLAASPEDSIVALLQTDESAALAGHRELRTTLFGLALAALASAVLLALWVSRQVTGPVHVLTAAAKRISAGNYMRPVEWAGSDEIGELAETFNQMQERIAAREEQIVYQASHDPLTGLYNRAVVNDRLVAAIARARRGGYSLAVLMLDLDRFKEINDKLGHKIGDLVLQRAAGCLLAHVRESDTVLRLGGDEFLIILENSDERRARFAATNFVNVLANSIELEDMQIALELSIGISVYPEHGDRPDMLLRRADIALYTAKERRTSVSVYEAGQDERHLRQLAIINDLGPALQRGEFSLHYQPKVEAKSGEVVQVEALLRWEHPEHGSMRADEFIPLAEQSGHIRQITRWVVEHVIEQCRRWRDRGLRINVAVNLSTLDLADEDLPDSIVKCLVKYEVPPSSLVLEVTETAVMQNTAQAVRVLGRFRACGIRIALDDFGTGHSSLAQLKRIPVDELKIDKSFVLQLKDGTEDAVIVRATIDLGRSMGLQVVAEGVEDQASWDLLERYGCDLLQGYYISRPLSGEDFKAWVEGYYRDSTRLRAHGSAVLAPKPN